MTKIDPKKPISMTFSVASIQEGIAFWLRNQVLRQEIEVESVNWDDAKRIFTVELNRKEVSND